MLLVSVGLVIGAADSAFAAKRKKKKAPKEEAPQAAPAEQEERAPANQGDKRIVVLKFETFNTSTEVMDLFYRSINERIKVKPGSSMVAGGEVTLSELLLALGCDEGSPECLSSLSSMVNADQMIFGTVQRSENVHLFTLKLFDFKEKVFVRTIEDETIEGDVEKLKEGIPALVEALLYGDVGVVDINVDGAQSPDVFFDGEKVGKAPVQLTDLPLGEHVIKLRTINGNESTKRIILRQGSPSKLSFSFQEITDPNANLTAGNSSPLILPGWVSVGVGVAALGFGAYNYMTLSDLEDQASAAYKNTRAVDPDDRSKIESDINSRQDEMNSAYTRMNIGLSVGIAGVVLGTGLLVYGYTSGGEDEATQTAPPSEGATLQPGQQPSPSAAAVMTHQDLRPDTKQLRLGVAPTQGGAALSVDYRF